MPYITVDSTRLFFVRRPTGCGGVGPTVLWIHGAGGNALLWGHVLQRMPGVAAVALDLPGHGRSSGPGQSTITAYADAVVGAAAALRLDSVVLVGHSMGGAVALEVAIREPSWLRGLALLSVTACPLVSSEMLHQLARNPAAARQRLIDEGYGPGTPAQARELAAVQLAAVDPEVLYGDYVACHGFDVQARLASIHFPAVVLCGAQDRITPPTAVRSLQKGLPYARLEMVPNAGHMLPLERPTAVAEAILHFLASLPFLG